MRYWVTFLLTVSAVVAPAATTESASNIPTIAGYELKLLDKRVPLQVSVNGLVEPHEIPIWVHMPKKGEMSPVDIDTVTDPVDLPGGTTVLPPPPPGFGLRAVATPYRETFTLSNGQLAVIETPVFIYFPRTLPETKLAATPPPAAPPPKPATLRQEPSSEEYTKRYVAMFQELRALRDQFSQILAILPDGAAKERLREVSGRLAAVTTRYDSSYAYNTDGSIDKDIH